MTIWSDAGAVIDAVFADVDPIIYTGAGLVAAALPAIRSDGAAPSFEGAGATLRQITYEMAQGLFPQTPETDEDTFTHRGRVWSVCQVERVEDVSPPKYLLTVTDTGPA